MLKAKRYILTCIMLLCGFLVLLESSCKKKDTKCKGIITVVDGITGAPIAGASVVLTAPSPSTIRDVYTTDGTGKVNMEYKLPATLEITATDPSSGNTGTGSITFKPGETTEKTVKVQ